MRQIVGIDPDKVQRYGKKFLKLIRTYEAGYEQNLLLNEDRPQDPNHETVVVISSEDEAEDYGHDLDDELGSLDERSSYFHVAPEVNEFNAKVSQLQAQSAAHAPRSPPQNKTASRGSKRGGSFRVGGGRGNFKKFRKASGGSSKSRTATDGKPSVKSSKQPSSRNSAGRVLSGGGGGPSRSGGGGRGGQPFFGGGGIGLMPT